MSTSIDIPWRALRVTYGLVPILAGLDKFTNLLTNWSQYLSPVMARMLPFSPQVFMGIVGVIEIIAGVIIFTRHTRLGACIVSAWLVLIAINLVTAHLFDIAVRDLAMAVGAYCLAKLTEAKMGVHRAARKAPAS